MEAVRDAYLLDVDKSSRPLQRFQEGSRLLKAAEEIVAVAQGLQKEFWDFWIMSHEARYLEIMRGLQESGDAVGAVIFARRYEGWADFGADGDPELLLDEIELLRSTLGLSEAVRTATGRHIKGNHDASGATQRAPDAQAVPEDVSVVQSESSAEAQEASPAAGGGSSSERVDIEPEAAAGGRDLRGRNRSDDGGGEPANPAAKVRAGRAPGRPPNGAGRGRGKKQ